MYSRENVDFFISLPLSADSTKIDCSQNGWHVSDKRDFGECMQ